MHNSNKECKQSTKRSRSSISASSLVQWIMIWEL